jgi:hypothetical protein
MNLIFFSRGRGKARHLNLSHPVTLTLVSLAAAALVAGVFAVGIKVGVRGVNLGASGPSALAQDRAELAQMRSHLQERIDGLALRMGVLNAHMVRLNALGKRLTQWRTSAAASSLRPRPALRGPEPGNGGPGAEVPDLSAMLDQFDRRLNFRATQFNALEYVLLGRQLSAEIRPTGRPVLSGYISSYFGERMDPFDGEEAFHKGLDFASDRGADVLAVAQGVVSWAGPRAGYGVLVRSTTAMATSPATRTTPAGGRRRRHGGAWPGDRRGRIHRPLHGAARAFRSAEGRAADRSDGLYRPRGQSSGGEPLTPAGAGRKAPAIPREICSGPGALRRAAPATCMACRPPLEQIPPRPIYPYNTRFRPPVPEAPSLGAAGLISKDKCTC